MLFTKHKTLFGHLLLVAVFSVIAMLPAYYNGIPSGNDQAQHFQFAWTVNNSVRSGDIYPELAGDTNLGFGDYGIRFYPPLTYYAFSAAYLLVRDWYFATLLVLTFAFFVGGIGIYLWVKDDYGTQIALVASLIYILAPYHLNQIYNNFLLAEFFAMAVIPFCFLFLTRVCRQGRWLDVAGLAVAYALLVLTHLPMTLVCSITMGLYGLMLLRRQDGLRALSKIFIAVLPAIAMTSFYWSRWVPEFSWIEHSTPKYFSGVWTYSANFLLLPDHFIHLSEDVLNLWLADLMLLTMLLISVPTLIYLARKKIGASRQLWAILAILIFAVFMTTPLSGFIWNNIDSLKKIQFPWRWTAIASVFGAVFASIGVHRAAIQLEKNKSILVPAGLGAILIIFVFMAVFITKSSVYIPRSAIKLQMETISDSEGCECWWPIWARRTAFNQTELVAGSRKPTIGKWTATEKQFHIDAGPPENVSLRAFYYPRWQSEVNGVPVIVGNSEDGTLSVPIPAEASDVRLRFIEPPYVMAANIVSVAMWIAVLALVTLLLIKSRKSGVPAAA